MTTTPFNVKRFAQVTLITSVWVHGSEVFRYFVLVIPRVKAHWNNLETVADMNWTIFGIWGLWDTLLTAMVVFLFWLYSRVFGNSFRSVMVSGTLAWLFFFVLYWIGAANMGYAEWSLLWITLPLSWMEVIVACLIAAKLYNKLEHE